MTKSLLELSDLASRLDLYTVLPKPGHGVEVGVWRGDFSVPFLDRWPGSMLLIDPWERLPDDEYDDVRNRDFNPADYEYVKRRVARFGRRAVLLRMRSVQAAGLVDDASLDFVHLDGNHSYAHAAQDIALWWPKVRPGGILSGHDLFLPEHPGVSVAVGEFLIHHALTGYLIHGERVGDAPGAHEAHTWYARKPC